MSRKRSKAVLEGNGPILHHDKFGSGEPTVADLYKMLKVIFDRMDKNLDRMTSRFDRQEKCW